MKNYISISREEELAQFIRGSLLGDGYLSPRRTAKTMSYMAFTHCPEQLCYLKWKMAFLEDLGIKCKMRKYTHKSERYKNKEYTQYTFISRSHPIFAEFRDMYYTDKKFVNVNDVKKMDEFALAVWYMDDGNVWNRKGRSSCITMNTQGFTNEDMHSLIDIMKNKWDIVSTFNKSERTIRISSKSCKKMIDMIKPYVPECMIYKTILYDRRNSKTEAGLGNLQR